MAAIVSASVMPGSADAEAGLVDGCIDWLVGRRWPVTSVGIRDRC